MLMDFDIHVPIFDIDGGTSAIAGELARVGPQTSQPSGHDGRQHRGCM
jgi:hypothetical protein